MGIFKKRSIKTLGKKKSDIDYTQDDLDILLPLARTLAIAISNADYLEANNQGEAVILRISAPPAPEIPEVPAQ